MEIILSLLKAFFVGGLICTVGQILIDTTKLTPGRILVGFVVAGVIMGALGIYEPIVNWAGCGATVPLTGFGYNLFNGTKEAIDSEGVSGILSGPLTSGATGITGAVICGLIASFIGRSHSK